MPIEQLTYEQMGERLGVTRDAVRALVKRHRLPRSKSNDGKTLVAVNFAELAHKPMSARSPRGGDQGVTDVVADLKAKVAQLESDLVAERQCSMGHRGDYERERERADRMVTTQDRLVGELEALRALLEADRPMTPRTMMTPVHSPAIERRRRWWPWRRSAE